MSIILKSTEMHIKNSNTNEYQTINAVAEQSADEAIARVESAKNTAISNIQTKASETTSEYPTNEEVAAMLAPVFSEATAYSAGDYVRYTSGITAKLYRITADHAAGVTWANTSKVKVNLGDEVSELNDDLNTKINNLLTAFNNIYTQFFTIEPLTFSFIPGALNTSRGASYEIITNTTHNATNLVETDEFPYTIINLMPEKYRFAIYGYINTEIIMILLYLGLMFI